MTEQLDIQAAAAAARQLVGAKIQLQSLFAVLDDLAGKENLVNELTARADTLRKEVVGLDTARELAVTAHDKRIAELDADFTARRAVEQERINTLTGRATDQEHRRDVARLAAEQEEQRLDRVRAALSRTAANLSA